MSKPDDIGQDVWDAAVKALSHETLGSIYAGPRVVKVARAILAERERCAQIAAAAGRTKLPLQSDRLLGVMANAMERGGKELAAVIEDAIRNPSVQAADRAPRAATSPALGASNDDAEFATIPHEGIIRI